MAFEFDKLTQLKCDHCGGAIDPADIPAEPPVNVSCPHCQSITNVPGKLGTLLVTEAIGKGAAGTVYKALDTTLQRWVAVKLLHSGDGDDKQIVEATVAEARALAALNHPNVVHVHNIGMRNGQPFIVMELLLGSGKLNVMLKEGWVADEQRGLEIGVDIAQALRASWNAGLLHRDVKPGNILFNDEGVAKLLDFSVVINENADEKVVIGTPYYISPEAAKAQDVDYRSDLYSLGATLFHLMTGYPPFAGETQRDTMRARFVGRAPDVQTSNPAISAPTAAIVAKLLERDPDLRFQSHDELIQDLREALAAHALMPASPAPTAHDELAAISQAANDTAVPVAAPRAPRDRPMRVIEAPKANNNKVIFGSIAAGVLVVVGIIIAVVAGGGNDDTDGAGSIADKDNKKNIFDSDGFKDRDNATKDHLATGTKDSKQPKPPDPTKDSLTKTTPTKDASNPTRDGKKNTDETGNEKDGNKQNETKQPQKTPQEIFEEKLTAWDQQTSQVLAKIKARKSTPWQTSPLTAGMARSNATLTADDDGAIAVTGVNPDTDTYTLSIPLNDIDPNQVKAIRLESLLDPAAPAKGASRSATGNFVLTGFSARIMDADGARLVEFNEPTASYAQDAFPITGTLDSDNQTGWAVSKRHQAPNVAVFPVKALGKSTAIGNQPDVVFESFEKEQLDTNTWTIAGDAFSKGTAKANEIGDAKGLAREIKDKRYLDSRKGVSGDKKQRLDAVGNLRSKPFFIQHQAIKFNLAGVGKSSIRLLVDGKPIRTTPVSGNRAGNAFESTGWDVRDLMGRFAEIEIDDPKSAFIAVDHISFTDDMTGIKPTAAPARRLIVTLDFFSKHKQHTLGHFRVSFSTSDDVAIEPPMPDAVKAALLNSKRTRADAATIIAFYKKHVEGGEPFVPALPDPIVKTTPTNPTTTPTTPKPDDGTGFDVILVSGADTQVKDEATALAVLDGKTPAANVTKASVPVVNFADGNRSTGLFGDAVPFPKVGDKAGFKDNFAVRVAGRVIIPEAGPYTFWLAADDHARLTIGSTVSPGKAAINSASMLTITFQRAGTYPISVDFAEGSGSAFVELAAVKGGVPTDRSTFILVGDTAKGGLKVLRPLDDVLPKLVDKTPEPGTPGTPTASKTIQSPGEKPETISRGMVWIDPQDSKEKHLYRQFALDDPDARVLIPRFAKWHYWSNAKAPTGTWPASDYNAGGWSNGESLFAIGQISFAKTVLNGMVDQYTQFYARTPFEIENLNRIGKLNLLVRTYDPCVVYLNGIEAARSDGLVGSGDKVKTDSLSPITGVQDFDLSKSTTLLKKGTNWIAIECHNHPSVADRRFIVDPVLVAQEVRILSEAKKNAKPQGWTPVETTSYRFDDALILDQQRGKKNPRLTKAGLSIDITRRGSVFFLVMVRGHMEDKGTFRITAKCKEFGSNKPYVLQGESRTPLVADEWQTHAIEIDTTAKRGVLESVDIFLPPDAKRMEIRWIGYTATGKVNPKRPVKGQFWDFTAKDD